MENAQNIHTRLEQLENRLSRFPVGYLVYKTIHGRKQPYLQWNDGEKTRSRYIKTEEREEILAEIQMRGRLLDEYKRLEKYQLSLASMWKKYASLSLQTSMHKKVSIGYQSYEEIIQQEYFYVDKTMLIRDWWQSGEQITLVTRPRRFGKTLNMDMLNCFFSVRFAGRSDLFEQQQIWRCKDMQELQGTFPVIFLSFSGVKGNSYSAQRCLLASALENAFAGYRYIIEGDRLPDDLKNKYLRTRQILTEIELGEDKDIPMSAIRVLSELLYNYYDKKVLLLIDEYDTPLQEAWLSGIWDDTINVMRGLFTNSLKSNPWLKKAFLTGITRIGKESLFSDMNNLACSSVLHSHYASRFGFTEEEVFAALDSQGYQTHQQVKAWYDGFSFGDQHDMYNPWSITNYLSSGRLDNYWANTSSNALVGKLLAGNSLVAKGLLEDLITGGSIQADIQENIIFQNLSHDETAVWSLLLASGYLKVDERIVTRDIYGNTDYHYRLSLTNMEVRTLFPHLVRSWFAPAEDCYSGFVQALLKNDLPYMNRFMNETALHCFSVFDTGGRVSAFAQPERFYHGFVLGLLVELRGSHEIRSNRESGFGRYDVMLIPRAEENEAYILEFKVWDKDTESDLACACQAALKQIKEKNYAAELMERGIPENRIHSYGFGFAGKMVRIESGEKTG